MPVDPRPARDLFEAPIERAREAEAKRVLEAALFLAPCALSAEDLAPLVPRVADVEVLLGDLAREYAGRGFELRQAGGRWLFVTAQDLAPTLHAQAPEVRTLTRAQMETLAVIAYHQPVTRAEIEEVRGVALSKGTLDTLLETGWIRMRGRRKSPGRPVTYGTTPAFLLHFSLEAISDLPGLDELRGAGLVDARLPPHFAIPQPKDDAALSEDETTLDDVDPFLEPLLDEDAGEVASEASGLAAAAPGPAAAAVTPAGAMAPDADPAAPSERPA